MDASLHGFDTKPTPPVKIMVGAQEQVLWAPRNLLLQIPYFAKKEEIVNGSGVETELRLSDADPTTVADLFHFVSSGIPSLDKATGTLPTNASWSNLTTRYIKAYITAHEWNLMWVLKPIRRELVAFHRVNLVNPEDANELYLADLEETFLYSFLISELSYDMCYGYMDRVKYEVNFWDTYPDVPRKILWDVLQHVHDRSTGCARCKTCQDCTGRKQPALQDDWLSNEVME